MMIPRPSHIRETKSGSKFIPDESIDKRRKPNEKLAVAKSFEALVQAVPEYNISMVYDASMGGATIYWSLGDN